MQSDTCRQTDEKSLKLYMVELLSDCNYFKLLKYANEGVKQHLAKYLLYIFASLNADWDFVFDFFIFALRFQSAKYDNKYAQFAYE